MSRKSTTPNSRAFFWGFIRVDRQENFDGKIRKNEIIKGGNTLVLLEKDYVFF
jgi:hypothetical protein